MEFKTKKEIELEIEYLTKYLDIFNRKSSYKDFRELMITMRGSLLG